MAPTTAPGDRHNGHPGRSGHRLLVSGLEILATYHTALRTCSTGLGGCRNLDNQVFQGGQYSRFFDMVDAVGFLLPLIMALFWGAPLVARELEEGSHRLAWTQSVTRLRWLGAKLACALGSAVVCAGVVSGLVTWWYRPVNAIQQNRFGTVIFDTQALVPVGYAIFGVALGCLMGTVLRRTLPAMGATLLIWGSFRYVFDEYLRPHLLAGHTVLVEHHQSVREHSGRPRQLGARVHTGKRGRAPAPRCEDKPGSDPGGMPSGVLLGQRISQLPF